jgi:hypothetical protein
MDHFKFIITAKGNHKLFKNIDLVDNACIKTWKFTAFIDSKETLKKDKQTDHHFIIHDINLKEDQVKFI